MHNKEQEKIWYEKNKDRINEQRRINYQKNKEQIRKQEKQKYLLNKDKILAQNKKWYYNNREKVLAHQQEYNKINRDKRLAQDKIYYQNNKEKCKLSVKRYRENNKDKVRLSNREYDRYKERTDLNFRLKRWLSCRISMAVKNQYSTKAYKTMELLGCTIQEFRAHIERQFTEGMSWENYGEWEIHHITACAYFVLTEPEQQKLCFHYTNLKPLWIQEHRELGWKIEDDIISISDEKSGVYT